MITCYGCDFEGEREDMTDVQGELISCPKCGLVLREDVMAMRDETAKKEREGFLKMIMDVYTDYKNGYFDKEHEGLPVKEKGLRVLNKIEFKIRESICPERVFEICYQCETRHACSNFNLEQEVCNDFKFDCEEE